MSERLDPEELKEITSLIFGKIQSVIGKYDGFIEKYVGDAIVALFGVHAAHEDDPVRAIRAAREIHELVEAVSPRFEKKIGLPLSMHTGINTGIAVRVRLAAIVCAAWAVGTIRHAVSVLVGVRRTAPAGAWVRLERVMRAAVLAVRRAVAIAVRVGHSAPADTRIHFVRVGWASVTSRDQKKEGCRQPQAGGTQATYASRVLELSAHD
jgi:hypothetical protein